jgi:hypothetical protein
MRVVVPPVLVGEKIVRIVSPVETLLEVEEWVGEWWEPSNITLTAASVAPVAPFDLLQSLGLPAEDCVRGDSRPAQLEIEALIRTRDPERPSQLKFDEEVVLRAVPSRRRKYPGNARFRRHASSGRDGAEPDPERRKKKSTDPLTPRRRASDLPPGELPDLRT